MRTFSLLLAATALCPAAGLEHIAGGGVQRDGATAKAIQFIEPFAVAFDSRGNYYVCEFMGHRVVRIAPDGTATVVAGTGQPGFSGDNGPAAQAMIKEAHGIVISRDDQMYIADTHNNRVRKVDLKSGMITTVAGNGEAGFGGDGGPALQATFHGIFAIDLDPRGRKLYIADLSNRRVRAVDLQSGTVTTIAGNGQKAVPEDGSPAVSSPLVDPRAVAADRNGNVYILERGGNALRVVDKQGRIRTLIAPGAISPDMKGPKHLTVDQRTGKVIIADAENNLIRVYDPKTRATTNVAGTGVKGDKIAPDGDPVQSQVSRPHGVTVQEKWLYISDSYNHRIVRMPWR
jgi:DNA-binding beta-propeller fold protein YncE